MQFSDSGLGKGATANSVVNEIASKSIRGMDSAKKADARPIQTTHMSSAECNFGKFTVKNAW
jgi:hypothetical protein